MQKNKNGFMTAWALALLAIFSLAFMAEWNIKGKTYYWIDQLKIENLFYTHLLTVDEWATRIIDDSKIGTTEVILETEDIGDTEDGFEIKSRVNPMDGLINIELMNLVWRPNHEAQLIKKFIRKLFPKITMGELNKFSVLINAGKKDMVIEEFGEYSKYFYIFPGDNDFRRESTQSDNVGYTIRKDELININEMPDYFYQMLSDGRITENPRNNMYKTRQDIRSVVGEEYDVIFKTSSMLYEVKGSIMIDNTERNYKIEIKNNEKPKTIKRIFL